MGNRVTVSIESAEFDSPVNIYGHWVGEEIYPVVQQALESSDRIGDGSYLVAEIIHAVFDGFGYIGKLGFGVWAGSDVPLVDDNPTMFVDADTGKWRVGEMEWQTRYTRVDEVL